jgi:hypothetical protein
MRGHPTRRALTEGAARPYAYALPRMTLAMTAIANSSLSFASEGMPNISGRSLNTARAPEERRSSDRERRTRSSHWDPARGLWEKIASSNETTRG